MEKFVGKQKKEKVSALAKGCTKHTIDLMKKCMNFRIAKQKSFLVHLYWYFTIVLHNQIERTNSEYKWKKQKILMNKHPEQKK